MHIDLRQKVIASIVGVIFALGAMILFPWWIGSFAIIAMFPFFLQVLTA